ncbi:MAG TPA: rhodanese-like domain-containing protein [Burkholderiales bacterium]|jgi:rhodanese-related sulfurtransferase|nr:rhodanese-like domain-containing protein [Burkholderiales bacterium]
MKFLIDNIHWVGLALISGGMLVWPALRRGGGSSVSSLNATLMMNKQDAVVVDVRDPEAYAAGHILNARNIPLKDLQARAEELQKYKKKPVILVCEKGMRSGAGATLLKKLGYEGALSLEGGLAAWRDAGLPTAK